METITAEMWRFGDGRRRNGHPLRGPQRLRQATRRCETVRLYLEITCDAGYHAGQVQLIKRLRKK
jgi:hypothetical protein